MLPAILVAVLTFGVLYLLDKGFTKRFRGTEQHKSGLSVRLPRHTATAGIVLTVLAAVVLMSLLTEPTALMALAFVGIGATGIGLLVYYMTFGIFYDEDKFVLTTFGRRSGTYYYKDIQCQQLYVAQGGGVIVELHMTDKRAVSLQSSMEGVYPFLDKAFSRWCAQKGIDPNACQFHDPGNSCWFPPAEG